MRSAKVVWVLAGVLLVCRFAQVGAADTVKIGLIDPLSGPFANVGEPAVTERINTRSTG